VWSIVRTRWARAEVKAGPLIVLGIIVLAAVGFWFYRGSGGESTNKWVKDTDAFAAYCVACKKDLSFTGADAKNIAKQGDKLQCPNCKKFEAQWGPAPPPARPEPPAGGSSVIQP
jgi:hypothetical protein